MPQVSEALLQCFVSECTPTLLTDVPTAARKTTGGCINDIAIAAVRYCRFPENLGCCLQIKVRNIAYKFAIVLRRVITGIEAPNSRVRLSYFSLK
jgi:hypothetical protein